MILPSIIKVSITALDAVPKEYEDASLALGATPEETWFRVSVPAAKSGIATAVVLGVGRAIGEAMAVMMVSGNVANMPKLFERVRFLTTAVSSGMGYADGLYREELLYSISDIERMAGHAMAVAKAALEMEEKKIEFSNQAKGKLAVLEQAVLDIVDRTVAAYGNFDREQAARIEPQEQVIDALVREVKSRHVRRLRDGLCTVEYGFVLENLLTACERTADHCSNVAVEMLQVAEGKLETHEYLNALKAGELQESAAFSERFARYKAQYAFPEEN